jgi:serine/threonine-protein kinase RsbW
VLLVSGLATNAIVHVGLAFFVWVGRSPQCIRVAVDDSFEPPVLSRPHVCDMGARWVAIVAELADQWGTEPTATGKRTWFQICSEPVVPSGAG